MDTRQIISRSENETWTGLDGDYDFTQADGKGKGGDFGDDTVKITKEGQQVNLNLGDDYTRKVDGNDVVLSADVEYYATIKVDKNTIFDGHLAKVVGGNWSADNTQTYANGVKDISDAFIDATYQKHEGTERIDKETYDALTDEEKAGYDFVDGTLRLTIQTGAAHSSDASYAKYRLTTDGLYDLESTWKTTGDYTDLTGETRAKSSDAVKFLFSAEDLEKINTTEGGYKYAFYTEEQYNGLDAAQKHTVSDLHIYEVVNGKPIEITDSYITAAKAAADLTKYNKDLYGKQISGTVTLTDFAKDDTPAASANVTMKDGTDLNEATYAATKTEDAFTGTRLNEKAASTAANETFDLGTGKDTITFADGYGTDTVTVNEDETLRLNFNAGDTVHNVVSGDDVVLSTDSISYYAKFTPSENVTWDTYTYEKDKEYTLELVKVSKSSNEAQLPNGTYTWGMVERDATASETAAGYGDKISLFLDYTDINAGKVFGADIEFHKVVNGEDKKVDASVIYGEDDLTAETFATANSGLYDAQREGGSVKLTGYAAERPAFSSVYVNDDISVDSMTFAATETEDGFVGSRFDDVATSTSANEKFDLGTGEDTITFADGYGDDTVTVNEDETLSLNFDEGDEVHNAVSGNDVVLSTDSISYYAKFTPSENVTWDTYTYEKDKEYTLELVKVSKSSNEDQLPSGSYTWGMVERDATASETEAGYGDKISLFLDYTDINAGKVFGADIEFHKVVNGEDKKVDASVIYGEDDLTAETFATANSGLYDAQREGGSVKLTDYAAERPADASVYVNDYSVDSMTFAATETEDGFVGSRFKDVAASTAADENFNLGTGKDEIAFADGYGNDKVTVNEDETLRLHFNTGDEVHKAVSGNDVVLSTDSISYYAKFTPSENVTWDTYTYEKDKEYTLELVKVSKSSNEDQLPSGSYTWGMVERDATASETEAGYGDKISLFLDYTDINAGKVFGADIEFHKVVNGEDKKVDASVIYGEDDLTAETFATANSGLYDAQREGGSVVLDDYAKSQIDANVYVNGSESDLSEGRFDVAVGANETTYSSKWLDEDIVSTPATGEGATGKVFTFNLDGSEDTLTGATSADTLNFSAADDVEYNRVGGDLVIKAFAYDEEGESAQSEVTIKDYFTTDADKRVNTIITSEGEETIDLTGSYFMGTEADETVELTVGDLPTTKITDAVLADATSGAVRRTETTVGEETTYTYSYNNGINGNVVDIDTFAIGGGGADAIVGTKRNDWINGGGGTDEGDLIFGGIAGYDMLSGQAGNDVIYAADTEGHYNTTGTAEIYGGAGNDYIYSASANGLIVGGSGNDEINLKGGANKVAFVNIGEDNLKAFGEDIVKGATHADTLKFSVDWGSATATRPQFEGYEFSDLSFERVITPANEEGEKDNDSLVITAGDGNKVTIDDFFNSNSKVNWVQALKVTKDGETTTTSQEYYGIAANATIAANVSGEYTAATGYDEVITATGDLSISNLSADDTLNFGKDTSIDSLKVEKQGDDLLITNGEITTTVEDYYKTGSGLSAVDIIVKEADKTLADLKIGSVTVDADADNLVFYKNGTELQIFDKSLNRGADPDAYKAIETVPNFYKEDGTTTGIAIYGRDSVEDAYDADLLVLNPAKYTDATDYPVYFTDAPEVSTVIEGAQGENSYIDAEDALYDLKITANDGAYNVIKAGIGNDEIHGGAGVDQIYGNDGHDTIYGYAGDDYIYGGNGDDEIDGGAGNDYIVTGEGNDIVTGGEGADTFNFGNVIGNKEITDATYEDKILTADADPFSTYGFVREGDDLVIRTAPIGDGSTITVKDFMKQEEDGSLDVTKNIDDINGKSILANATIDVFVDEKGKYIGTDYNERLKLADGDSVVMGKGDNEVELVASGTADKPATHEATVTLTNGESFTFNPANYDKDVVFEQIIDVTNPKKPKATDDVKLTFTKHNDDGDLLDTFVVTLKGYAAKTNNALVSIRDYEGYTYKDKLLADYDYLTYAEGTKQLAYDASDVVKNKVTGSDLSDSYDLSAFVSSNGVKGVTINTGAGNDEVVGSDFNDTVKVSSLAGQSSVVAESAGTNKVTFGKGNDEFKADKYSSNNVTMGEGNNAVELSSTGTNKVTAKNGNNEFKVNAGYNTITAGNGVNAFDVNGGVNTVKSGKGNNSIDISGGLNKVTTGKGDDNYVITGGNNTINSGASATAYNVVTGLGGDQFVIQGGSNTIKSTGSTYVNIGGNAFLNNITTGAKNDMFVIAGGVNNIKGGAGHDYYEVKGGTNFISDSKGSDIYDFTDADSLATSVTDKNGANDLVFDELMDVFFDVSVKTKKAKDGTVSVKSYKADANTISFVTWDTDIVDGETVIEGTDDFVKFTGKKTIDNIYSAEDVNAYKLNNTALDAIAQDVAGFLAKEGYASTQEYMADENADINTLMSYYAGSADNVYTAANV